MRRTIVHFTDTAGFGGAEQMLLTTLAGLDRQRWRCVLMHHPNAGATELAEGARRLNVETRTVPGARGFGGAANLPQLVRAIRAERPALLHAHLIGALRCTKGILAARLAGVPGVLATQQLYPSSLSRRKRMRQRLISIAVDRYVAVSHAMARGLRHSVAFGDRVAVIHNAIDVAAFSRAASTNLREALTGGVARPIVLTVARLNKQKGLEYLITAAARLPDTLFVIAGEGPDREALEVQARALNAADRVTFLGHRGDVLELLAACDLFVLPSLSEGLPVSVLEAMAAGKPVVATAIGGTDEAVLHQETGLLVPPGDPVALATAIRTLLADPGLSRRVGAAGRQRVQQLFSAETMVGQISRLYEDVLGARTRNGRH
jgi:glycosyltransferase involved in cell wall biosynthesis